ncbi:hypothetical protein [Photobacterium sp. Hal280]|uniref:hypothetical protein n=1 Tax=Photobacterium sp. Hal280 TaxID=3035163 RepID=UPI00301E53E8
MLSVKTKKSEVLFLSLTPLQYWLVNFISKAIKVKTYVIMHGELGYLNHAEGRGQKLGAKFIDATLKSKSDVEFIAISSTIFDRISSKYPTRKFSYIEHPLQDFSGINKIKNDKLTFGSFGIQSKEKNSCQIYKLAELVENKFHSRLNLITVGVSNGTFDYDLSDNVKHFCKGHIKSSLIEKETFFENVSQIDVFLLFSQGGDKYDLVSSGVFADCIAMQKPIIGMRTPMLSRCFELYGEIGVLCDSLDDMKNAIYNICQDEELLKKYAYNLQEIKNDFSFDSYVKKLDGIMNK